MADDFAILTGDPETYRGYAADYFGTTIPVDAVAHVLAGRPLDDALVARLRPGATLVELGSDLAEIGYGAAIA